MRRFFLLTYDDREDLQAVSDYEIGEFDATFFWSGEPYPGIIPENVRLLVGEGDPSDFLGNPISWKIVSQRFLGHIARVVPEKDFEIFPAPLYNEKSLKPMEGYSVV